MNRFWLFSAENVFDFGLLPKIYSAYSCLWSKSIPTCWRWCRESKTPPCENGQNLQSLVSFHVIYESDLLLTGNIRSYDSSYKLAANSQCIWYFVLTFKYSYCLTGFSKIYWCMANNMLGNLRTISYFQFQVIVIMILLHKFLYFGFGPCKHCLRYVFFPK